MEEASITDSSVAIGRITDEGIAKMRERIGVVTPQATPYNIEASADGIRHFTNGYGDENPLYSDPEYAAGTRWGSLIASPLFVMSMGVSEVKAIRPEIRKRGAHALAGVHEFLSSHDWEFFRPLVPGDRLSKRYYLCGVEERQVNAGRGRTVLTRYRSDFTNQRGDLVAIERFGFVRVERDAKRSSGKQETIKPTFYSDEQIEEIDAAYANQAPPRGAETRYWEDVQVGEVLPTLVKGPLTTTDTIVWMRGWGSQVQGHRLAWKHRQRAPKFFSRNEHNAWDIVERVHWDDAMARAIGNPAAYDFGRMRCAFLSHLVTNWMGDDAWLWRLNSEYRRFHFVGDTQWVKGRVVDKSIVNGCYVVDLEIVCENQNGEATAPGSARVVLASRAGGPAQLPAPDGTDDVPLIY